MAGMNDAKCPACGGKMVRNGRTAAGRRRWLCGPCRAATAHRIDNDAKLLKTFPDRLFPSRAQAEGPWSARTFRRKCAKFWDVRPVPRPAGEAHRVVFGGGIHVAKNVVALIAGTEGHVIGWHLARSENSGAWSALMSPIPPPDVAVTDGGTGFEKAGREVRPETRVQRRALHAFGQAGQQTTAKPKLQAGVELYGLARSLLRAKTPDSAAAWPQACNGWCGRWEGFLAERALDEGTGGARWTRERLVAARSGLDAPIRRGHLLTFLGPRLTAGGPVPSTDNGLEGGVDAPLREMLRLHRGMGTLRRAEAVFRWCCMHSEYPLPAAGILRAMPADDGIAELYRSIACEPQKRDGPAEWGDGLVWAEMRRPTPRRIDWD